MPSTNPDDNRDRHGNLRAKSIVQGTLGRTLASYVSEEDEALTRDEFLRMVRDRISSDLLGRTTDPRDGANT